eukprot:2871545-Amphidinium_carterae.1
MSPGELGSTGVSTINGTPLVVTSLVGDNSRQSWTKLHPPERQKKHKGLEQGEPFCVLLSHLARD